MKTIILSLMFVAAPLALSAQEPNAAPTAADTAAAQPHILFEGVPVQGDIYEFYKVLERRGFKLLKRISGSDQYAMKGTVAGNTCEMLISYSHQTRTVYRIMARPKHVNTVAYLDSLKVRYGEPYDVDGDTYKWMLPNGMVMFKAPDSYDPTLVVLDALGVKAYREEEDASGARMPNGGG